MQKFISRNSLMLFSIFSIIFLAPEISRGGPNDACPKCYCGSKSGSKTHWQGAFQNKGTDADCFNKICMPKKLPYHTCLQPTM